MNFRMIGRFISKILFLEAIFMIPALLLCLADGDTKTGIAFLSSIIIIFLAGLLLKFFGRNAGNVFHAREGFVCVGLSWIVLSLLGALPFVISGEIPHYIDALFEMVSGFTTTGSSILREVESHTRGFLYWRSFSHWVGGMGILVFLLAIVRGAEKSQGFTMHLLRAESPGPDVGKLVPKMKQTAFILYKLYFTLTILNFAFLLLGGMNWFEALCTTFGTAGTGGFGVKNDSIASYSPYIQNVCTVFMLLFGVNFSCFFLLVMRKFKAFFRDEELRVYFCIVAGSIALVAINIFSIYGSVGSAIRHSAFQVATVITTTGFATADFNLWPSFAKTILVILMFVGACAGSTGGGIKVSRVILLFKSLRRNIRQALHPNKVMVVRMNKQVVNESILANTNAYLAAYVIIVILSILIVSLDGFSLETNLTAVAATFNNIGPGLDMVGPSSNYADFSILSKIVLTIDMLAGRLEIFPILILISRSTWKNR